MTPSTAWLAGFFEGEGTLRINRATGRSLGVAHASLVSTDREYVEAFNERWPGYIRETSARERRQASHRWNIGARKLISFLDDIEPHVVGDRMQARINVARQFIALKASRVGHTATDEYREASWTLYALMRELNAQGPTPADPVLIGLLAEQSAGWRCG